MAERPHSRLEAARRQVAAVKRVLAVASTTAFGAALLWAHGSHPGTPATGSPSSTSTATASLEDSGTSNSFDFGQSSLAPSAGAAPDTSSHAS